MFIRRTPFFVILLLCVYFLSCERQSMLLPKANDNTLFCVSRVTLKMNWRQYHAKHKMCSPIFSNALCHIGM